MVRVVCFVAVLALSAGVSCQSEERGRPALDKRDYVGSVNVHLNPWFPLDKAPIHGLGGPNRSWLNHTGKDVWKQGMLLTQKYGVTAWSLEVDEPQNWSGVWRTLLDAAEDPSVHVKIGSFFAMFSKGEDALVKSLTGIFTPFAKTFASGPSVSRIGGAPVVIVYFPAKFDPAGWLRVFRRLDAACGRMAYLLDVDALVRSARAKGGDAAVEGMLEDYLSAFDGITCYASGTELPWKRIAEVMRRHPEKVFEMGAHNCYCNHFHMGGNDPQLTERWRTSLEQVLECRPDSIMLTNLFDQYENSDVYPSYDCEDFMLRYLEYVLERWKGRPFERRKTPEIAVANPVTALLGRTLSLEVMSFPVDAAQGEVAVALDLCDTSGKVIHAFPERRLKLDAFHVEKYAVPSTRFSGARGIVPRLTYRWNGETLSLRNPMTVIEPSIRGYRMCWVRSTKNLLRVRDGDKDWRIDGVGAGGTHVPSPDGTSLFEVGAQPVWEGGGARGISRATIKRDAVEFDLANEAALGYQAKLLAVPNPMGSLHWYYAEYENANGAKFQTLPIWEAGAARLKTVRVPVWQEDGTIADHEIEDVRVPYWHFPCRSDSGYQLKDISGWGHHGIISRSKDARLHMGYTGYNHYHNSKLPVASEKGRIWRTDTTCRGFLRFDGTNDCAVIAGGTAFPGACTYELCIRPRARGREMGLVGTANGQMDIALLPDGRVLASRKSAREGPGGAKAANAKSVAITSKKRLAVGQWARIAVVYDLKTLRLLVDGREEASGVASPIREHEWINHVVLGARCQWLCKAADNFCGDMRNIRIFGRNLADDELLK